MAELDYSVLLGDFWSGFSRAQEAMEELAAHLPEDKAGNIRDLVGEIGELHRRVQAASKKRMEVEVARAIAVDCQLIGERWLELAHFLSEEVRPEDYVYPTEEERYAEAQRARRVVEEQVAQALDVAGAMYTAASEWRRAAECFHAAASTLRPRDPLMALPALVKEYRCYEELGDMERVLQLGQAMRRLLGGVRGPMEEERREMLKEAAGQFRKTAMAAITRRHNQPQLLIPIGGIYLWCEAEALSLAAEEGEETPSVRFRGVAEYLEQMAQEELTRPHPSWRLVVSSYVEGALAYLRVEHDLAGLSKEDARRRSMELQRRAADFMLHLMEGLGYLQVTVGPDPSRTMKGLLAVIERVSRSYREAEAFFQLTQVAGEEMVWAQQRGDQATQDVSTVFRWLCEGVGQGLRAICLKLISDIYRLAVHGVILDVGSKEELRQHVYRLLNLKNDGELLPLLLREERRFTDVANLFRSLDLFWVAALCKQCQGQLRQNIGFLEPKLGGLAASAAPGGSPPEYGSNPSSLEEGAEGGLWRAAPSRDFAEAADLYYQAFRLQLGAEEDEEELGERSWVPRRDPDDLRRRAAQSRRLAGLAHFEEGKEEQGWQELIRAKDAYELLDRHRDAIGCLEVLRNQLIAAIRRDGEPGARPTSERLARLVEVCDELVDLYARYIRANEAVSKILGIIQFLREQVGVENWSLMVFLRAVEYAKEAIRLEQRLDTSGGALEMLRRLRQELMEFLGSEFAIGVYPDFSQEATVYFETETPVKLAILNISERERSNLTIRPVGVLPHLSPRAPNPWEAARDPNQITLKNFYVGCDDEAYDLNILPKPAAAFGPPQTTPAEPAAPSSKTIRAAAQSGQEVEEGEQPWLAVMWSGDYQGVPLPPLSGATEEAFEGEYPPSIHDLTEPAFFTVFTKAAREGNMIPGRSFPVTFGIYERGSTQPIATCTIHFKIASRPKILVAETNWVEEVRETWDETFSIRFDKGAYLPRYVPRFAPEFEEKDYVNPASLTPTITLGSEAVELTKHLKEVPPRFTLRYRGRRRPLRGHQLFKTESTIHLYVPVRGPVGGEYEFMEINMLPRLLSPEELENSRLRNGVNFQETFFGTVFIGDSKYDGEYWVYRLWCCFEPGEREPTPGAAYRRGWTNHRIDIFIDPRSWEPRLLVTDYYVQLEGGRGEWVEALYGFKTISSTLFGIRRLTAHMHRQERPSRFHQLLADEIRRAFQPLGVGPDTPLQVTGFQLGQRFGAVELIRLSWARDRRDGPVNYKPPRAHLFRDYWSNRYEHGLYREDWRGGPHENRYEMRSLDRTGGKSKYVRGLGERLIPHEIAIIPRSGDRCDLAINPPGNQKKRLVIRNVINPRRIELWTRPHISFTRRFNWFAKHFGRPPKIHTASLYLYSTRRQLNPYYKGRVHGKDQWVHYPEPHYWNGKTWAPLPEEMKMKLRPENLAYDLNSWLEADTYWVYRYVWRWSLEWTFPLPHEDWERADIWINARTGNIEWITSDYHWRELWYESNAKISGVPPIIDFLFNWNTPEPLSVKDGAQVHRSIARYFTESRTIGEFADQLPWMFARYRQSAEHLHQLHSTWLDRHKVKLIYSTLIILILLGIMLLLPQGRLFLRLLLHLP